MQHHIKYLMAGLVLLIFHAGPIHCGVEEIIAAGLEDNAKIIAPQQVLADYRNGKPETDVIILLHPSSTALELEDRSAASVQEPPVFGGPGAPPFYNLRDRSVREQLRATVNETVGAAIDHLGTAGMQVTRRFSYQFGFAARVTESSLWRIVNHPSVAAVVQDRVLRAHMAQGIPLMHASAPRSAHDGSGVSIAVCDTGIDTSHPMLGGDDSRIFNAKVIGGYDTGDLDADPRPDSVSGHPHGTACAGIAAGDAGTVGDYIGGVAPGARLYSLKISTGDTGSASSSAMIAAWEWAITHQDDDPANPIMIISTSFGGGRYTAACDGVDPSMTAAAANAVAAGITIFVSAGNDGYCDAISWPACISSVNSVGAVYDDRLGTYGFCVDSESCAGSPDSRCTGTSKLAWDDTSPDLVTSYSNSASFLTLLAPSHDAYTTDIAGAGGGYAGDYYPDFGGTSAASPYAAGAAAVLQNAAWERSGSYLNPAEVAQLLVDHGDSVTDGKAAVTRPRINLTNAVNALPAVTGYTLTVEKAGSGTGAVTSSPAGIDCGTDCTGEYPENTTVTLTAAAGSGSTFAGWSGACTGMDACVLTMDQPRTVTAAFTLACFEDLDRDGYGSGTLIPDDGDGTCETEDGESTVSTDCDDSMDSVHPGAEEVVANGIDENCDGVEECYPDLDNDGYRPDGTATVTSGDLDCIDSGEAVPADPAGDCNDADPGVHPGAAETIDDGIDQDCDTAELCYADLDDDGYRPDTWSTTISADLDCADGGEAASSDPSGDCNDADATVHPGAAETVADGIDQDCDGSEICYRDNDGDTFGTSRTALDNGNLVCTDAGESPLSTDCDDLDPDINPGAPERCDGIDNNCDARVDEDGICRRKFWLLFMPVIQNGGEPDRRIPTGR